MLMGYALENMSKCLEVMDKTKPGSQFANRLNLTVSELGVGGHEILKRLDRLDIHLEPKEEEAVQIAVDHVIWAGKYRVPMRPGEHCTPEDMPAVIKERQKYADVLGPVFDMLCRIVRERSFRYFGIILG
jgi:hypothetical protein